MSPSPKVLFLVSGSIAAYKACDVVSRLTQWGAEVRVVVSKAALRFVGASTWEGLSGYPVFRNTFEEGRQMDHIALERWADGIVLCPASADRINKLAAGFGDDAMGAMMLAHEFKKPVLIFPAMNGAMWEHPATRASIEKLTSWGMEVHAPEEGPLACGEVSLGRLQAPEKITEMVWKKLGGRSL